MVCDHRTHDREQRTRRGVRYAIEFHPIDMARHRILEKKFANEDTLKKVDASVRDLINQAAEFATHDPEPDVSELYTNIYR